MYDSWSKRLGIKGRDTVERYRQTKGTTLAGVPIWTDDQKAAVRAHYPDFIKLCVLLPNRTEGAIRKMAQKLGLCPKRRVWKPEQERKLPPPYVGGEPIAEIQVALEDKTKRQIYGKARRLRVRRPRRPPKETGMLIVDLIRRRVFDLGFAMVDLDEWVARKRYFQAPRKYDWIAITKALKILGGRIVPIWPN